MQVTISFKRRLHFPVENSAKIYRDIESQHDGTRPHTVDSSAQIKTKHESFSMISFSFQGPVPTTSEKRTGFGRYWRGCRSSPTRT
jgi:hypothetical protein